MIGCTPFDTVSVTSEFWRTDVETGGFTSITCCAGTVALNAATDFDLQLRVRERALRVGDAVAFDVGNLHARQPARDDERDDVVLARASCRARDPGG